MQIQPKFKLEKDKMKNENSKYLQATVAADINSFCTGLTCPEYLSYKPLDFILSSILTLIILTNVDKNIMKNQLYLLYYANYDLRQNLMKALHYTGLQQLYTILLFYYGLMQTCFSILQTLNFKM